MRNAKQGNIGRQLGVTKVFDIKVHMANLKNQLVQDLNKAQDEKTLE